MDGFAIDGILLDDKSRSKQQHTAKRIFERLRDEYGFTGGIRQGAWSKDKRHLWTFEHRTCPVARGRPCH